MAASTWVDVVHEILRAQTEDGNYRKNLNKIIKGIVLHQWKFYEFVELLGTSLSDTNEMNRANGCKLLTEVLQRLPRNYLTTQEVNFLSTFMRDRLQDKDSVVTHTLHGIATLIKMENLSDEDAVAIVCSIIQEIGPLNQSRKVTDRRNVYLVFHNLLQSHLNALKTMGLDFVSGFIQTMDGEKDPRNLVLVFNMIPQIVHNFNIDPFIEDLFEVTGCYFPIDYSPPPNDTNEVTRDDLILGLRNCLSSTSKFSDYCLPLLMEKIESEVPNAKIDALLTLSACAEVYAAENLKPFYVDAYRSIRREVCSNESADLEKAALTALTALVKSVSAMKNGHNYFSVIVSEILNDSVPNLSKEKMKLIYHSAKLLQATAIASYDACELVMDAVIPLLVEQFTLQPELQLRNKILDVLNGFLETCRRNTLDDFQPLKKFKSLVLNLNIELLSGEIEWDANLRRAGLIGLLTLATTPFLLSENEVASVISLLAKVIVNDLHPDVRREAIEAISKVATEHSVITRETLLPHLLNTMRTTDTSENNEICLYENHLLLLAAVTTDLDFLKLVTPDLLTHLHESLSNDKHFERTKAISVCLLDIAEKTCTKMSSFWSERVLTALINLADKHWQHMMEDRDTLTTITNIHRTVVPCMELVGTREFLFRTLEAHSHGEIKVSTMITFVESLLSCARIELFAQIPENLIDTIVTNCLTAIKDSDVLYLSSCRCLASLANKMMADESLKSLLTRLLKTIRDGRHQKQERLVTLLIWLTKALALKGDESMSSFIDEMFIELEDEVTCEQIANGFEFILADTLEALNNRCHARVLLFHKQRFFLTTCPRLINGVKFSKSPDVQYAHLKALILQLPLLPKEAFVSDLPTLIPILIKGMVCNRAHVLLPILTTLLVIIKHDPKLIGNDADTLVPHLLQLSSYKGAMKVRIASLRNINFLINLPQHLAVQHKENIVHELASALDDPKRLVRKAAATARAKWYLLGSPGGI